MIERLFIPAYRSLRALLFPFLSPEWQAAFLISESAAKRFLRMRMRFLAAGIITPMTALAILTILVHRNGPIPETPAMINGLKAMVGFQVVCTALAVIEAVSLCTLQKPQHG